MLCPFHYFGVSDIAIDGTPLNEQSGFRYLVTQERVKHIIDKINFYGYCGERVKGLIFCSNKKEAIERLEQDELYNCLDYIFTVDIFNQGVDIPTVNQVVMLRPTQSSIVFVQQLGRGLRKSKFKEYVVIIDFVGNYNNNFLILNALNIFHN